MRETDDTGRRSRVVHQARDGVSCALGRTPEGWFAGTQVRPDRDLRYRERVVAELTRASGPSAPRESVLSPILAWSHTDRFERNSAPIQPLVELRNGNPIVFFKRFRFDGRNSFGWDVYHLDHGADGWHPPSRISGNAGYPDSAYAVATDGPAQLLFHACCTDHPRKPWTWGGVRPNRLPVGRPDDTRTELQEWDRDTALTEVAVPDSMVGRYGISPPVVRFAQTPPRLDAPRAPKYLLWADMHVHSTHSKCMASMDGTVRENLLYQREILGCDVLCLAEHTHVMNDAELSYMCDALEDASTSNGKLAVWAECNGVPPGSELTTDGEVRITAWFSCTREVDRIAFLRDGEILEWKSVGEEHGVIELTDTPSEEGAYWYSITAQARSPFPFQPVLCHASPIFVNYVA